MKKLFFIIITACIFATTQHIKPAGSTLHDFQTQLKKLNEDYNRLEEQLRSLTKQHRSTYTAQPAPKGVFRTARIGKAPEPQPEKFIRVDAPAMPKPQFAKIEYLHTPVERAIATVLQKLEPLKLGQTLSLDIDGTPVEVFQVRVYDQTKPDGGGGLSCGYHSLKNGTYLLRALHEPETSEANIAKLNDPAIIAELFGPGPPCGRWRKEVEGPRLRRDCIEIIYNWVKDTSTDSPSMDGDDVPPDINPAKILGAYEKALKNIVVSLVDEKAERVSIDVLVDSLQRHSIEVVPPENRARYSATDIENEIKAYFYTKNIPDVYEDANAAWEAIRTYIRNRTTLLSFLPGLSELQVRIEYGEFDTGEPYARIKKKPSGLTEEDETPIEWREEWAYSNGENLIDGEVTRVYEEEFEPRKLLHGKPDTKTTIFTPSDLFTEGAEFLDDYVTFVSLREAITTFDSTFHCFVMNSGSQPPGPKELLIKELQARGLEPADITTERFAELNDLELAILENRLKVALIEELFIVNPGYKTDRAKTEKLSISKIRTELHKEHVKKAKKEKKKIAPQRRLSLGSYAAGTHHWTMMFVLKTRERTHYVIADSMNTPHILLRHGTKYLKPSPAKTTLNFIYVRDI
ncbi:hypothetical protein HN446_01400 [bacterium]|nr:hypothetical protein [bacterium]